MINRSTVLAVASLTGFAFGACNRNRPDSPADNPVRELPKSAAYHKAYLDSGDLNNLQAGFPARLFDCVEVKKSLVENAAGIAVVLYSIHSVRTQIEPDPVLEGAISAAQVMSEILVGNILGRMPDQLLAYHPEILGSDRDQSIAANDILTLKTARLSASLLAVNARVSRAQVDANRNSSSVVPGEISARAVQLNSETISRVSHKLRSDLGGGIMPVLDRDLPVRLTSNRALTVESLELIAKGFGPSSVELIESIQKRDRETVRIITNDLPERPIKLLSLGDGHDLKRAIEEYNAQKPDSAWSVIEIRIDPAMYLTLAQNYQGEMLKSLKR